jgi:hypothetical protein
LTGRLVAEGVGRRLNRRAGPLQGQASQGFRGGRSEGAIKQLF